MNELLSYRFTDAPVVLTEKEIEVADDLACAILVLEKVEPARSAYLDKQEAHIKQMKKDNKISAEEYKKQMALIDRAKDTLIRNEKQIKKDEKNAYDIAYKRAQNPITRTSDMIGAKIDTQLNKVDKVLTDKAGKLGNAIGNTIEKHPNINKGLDSISKTGEKVGKKVSDYVAKQRAKEEKMKEEERNQARNKFAHTYESVSENEDMSDFIQIMIESELASVCHEEAEDNPNETNLSRINTLFKNGKITRAEYIRTLKEAKEKSDIADKNTEVMTDSVTTMLPQNPSQEDVEVMTKTFESESDFLLSLVNNTFGDMNVIANETLYKESEFDVDRRINVSLNKLKCIDCTGRNAMEKAYNDLTLAGYKTEGVHTENLKSDYRVSKVMNSDSKCEIADNLCKIYGGMNRNWQKYVESVVDFYHENEYMMEAANIDGDMKSIIETLNRKGYKTKYSCAGHPGSYSKKDGDKDHIAYGKRYSTAHIMFDGNYNFPSAPKHWYFKTVEGKDYLDVREPHEPDTKRTDKEKNYQWKDNYMGTLKTWVDNLPPAKETEKILVDKKGEKDDVVTESSKDFDAMFDEYMFDLKL